MLFNSIHFMLFFPVVAALYYALPHRHRWLLLLTASYYFYMSWNPAYIFLILLSTIVDYFAGLQMGKVAHKVQRKKYLTLSLLVNLGLLFTFKYFDFFRSSLASIRWQGVAVFADIPMFDLLLPVGISFYTFQTLSYSLDVYQGKRQPERHFGLFALYVSFFPQLVAGPIERSTRLLPQFSQQQTFDYQRVTDGLKLMTWGLFKKLVIADRIAESVNLIYNHPTEHVGAPLIAATYLFAFQIFCDFSGYSDIAIGAAQVLGFDLMENFRQPYFSESIAEFWRRWHISLSTWFRDYLYVPLGGNRVTKWRWYYNLLLVFVVSGLWHGANWTFVLWGAVHGLYMIIAIVTKNLRQQLASRLHLTKVPWLHKALNVFITFHLVTFAWIFFRANSITDAFYIVTHLFSEISLESVLSSAPGSIRDSVLGGYPLITTLAAIGFMELVHLLQTRTSVRTLLMNQPTWVRWFVYLAAVFSILIFGEFNQTEFIYFQF